MLKKKDLELQESLIKFNKFLQENDSKRNRAEKKQLDEKKQKQVGAKPALSSAWARARNQPTSRPAAACL